MITESYKPEQNEIRSAFQLTGRLRGGGRQIGIIILAAVCVLVLAVNIIADPSNVQNYILVLAVAAILAVAGFMTKRSERSMVESAYNGAPDSMTVEFIPMSLTDPEQRAAMRVSVGNNGRQWNITKADVSKIYENEQIFAVELKDARIVVLPKRVLTEQMCEFLNNNFQN